MGIAAASGGEDQHVSPGHPVRLLDYEPELGEGLSELQRSRAYRQILLPTARLDTGSWGPEQLDQLEGVHGEVHGFLVLSGAITIAVSVAQRDCVRLIGPGELVLLDGIAVDALPAVWAWSTLQPARLAIFDQRLLIVARYWPVLHGNILKLAAAQTRHAVLQQAISQLPRVEDRLLALFLTLADRYGTVRPDAVWLPLALTHETLAKMIGARRPTVSVGLGRLAHEELVTASADGWLIAPRAVEALTVPAGREAPLPADLTSAI